jgi:hypothetical protein
MCNTLFTFVLSLQVPSFLFSKAVVAEEDKFLAESSDDTYTAQLKVLPPYSSPSHLNSMS